jgi:hypothetical protein
MIDDEQFTPEQGGFQGFAWTSDEKTSAANDGAKAAGTRAAANRRGIP